ncbi:methyltransferase domain protein [Aeromicrobium marinum DSM 15272]|uniref:Methyltransferase domain protein n=1 Tax=Aeromicrobium marinum DSM 15272 TaxID=585531 RepID=E2SCJ0_9ACTN|nr:class I SAM-dependent methyltransferase [Aeromicrobium marinum]EFQ82943.1 methyltransferase domain protein [Aeromicrobium marinum DSM 15272]
MTTPRWFTDTKDGHSQWYAERFRALAEEGADLAGEARLVNALVQPASSVLDAGCGTGRLGAALHSFGHEVVGVDVDAVLVAEARAQHAGPTWVEADLAGLDLGRTFDAVVTAGNVMVFLAPGTEGDVVRRLAAHVAPGGVLVLGFRLDWHYGVDGLDTDLAAAGLVLEQRFATWDLRPFDSSAEFAVSVARQPEAGRT